MSVSKIKAGVYHGASSGSVMQVTRASVEPDGGQKFIANTQKYALWGTDNNYGQRLVDSNKKESTSAACLEFKIKAHYGQGLYLYKKEYDNGKEIQVPLQLSAYPEIEDFFEFVDIDNYLQGVITDYEWFNMPHTEFVLSKSGKKIADMARQKTLNVRPEIINRKTGLIENYYISAFWPDAITTGDYTTQPRFDKRNPFANTNSIYVHTKPSVDAEYFVTPHWHANVRWVELAVDIADWIKSNMDNSINLKYHIKVPQEYFELQFPLDRYEDGEERDRLIEEAEVKKIKEIDEYLTGKNNPGKFFYSKFATDPVTMKPMPGWEIDKIDNEIHDKAYLSAYNVSQSAIATAHNVPPSLAGISRAESQNAGSGSDVREQFNHYLQLHTVIPRQTTLEALNIVKRVNGWPREVHFGYENIVLETLDKNKSGFAQQNEPTPTTANK